MTMLSKPTIDDIEAYGYKVLTKSEYEQMTKRSIALENLLNAYKERQMAGEALQALAFGPDTPCTHCEGKGYHHGFGEDGRDPDPCIVCGGDGIDHSASSMASAEWDAAEERMEQIVAELEAMK